MATVSENTEDNIREYIVRGRQGRDFELAVVVGETHHHEKGVVSPDEGYNIIQNFYGGAFMGYGTHRVPDPMQDEDKWLFLTRKQLILVLAIILIDFGIGYMFWTWNILPVGIVLAVVITMVYGVLMIVEVPDDKYLFGSGKKLGKLVVMILKKKLPFNRVLYTKNLDNGMERWKEK